MASILTKIDSGNTYAWRPTLTNSRPTMPRVDSFTTPYERVFWEPKPTFRQQCRQLILDTAWLLLAPFAYAAAALFIMACFMPIYLAYKLTESNEDPLILHCDMDALDLDMEDIEEECAVKEAPANGTNDKRVDSLF